jgi:hypothetical protein
VQWKKQFPVSLLDNARVTKAGTALLHWICIYDKNMQLLTNSQLGTHEHFYRRSPCRKVARFACASVPEQGLSLISLQNALQHDVTAKEQRALWPVSYVYKITILVGLCMQVHLYCHTYNSIQNQTSQCQFSSDNRILTYSSTKYFQKPLLNHKCLFHIT